MVLVPLIIRIHERPLYFSFSLTTAARCFLQPEPDAFFGSSSCSVVVSWFLVDGLSVSSCSRLSCWWVSLCHADLRKPSFLWSEALFAGGFADDEDEDGDDLVDAWLFLWEVN